MPENPMTKITLNIFKSTTVNQPILWLFMVSITSSGFECLMTLNSKITNIMGTIGTKLEKEKSITFLYTPLHHSIIPYTVLFLSNHLNLSSLK